MTTANDVFAAFEHWRCAAQTRGVLMLFSDGSGRVLPDGPRSDTLFSFYGFVDAVTQLDAATAALLRKPQIGDTIAVGNDLFKVTDDLPHTQAVRADRAAYGDPAFVLSVPYARLKQRLSAVLGARQGGTPVWDVV